MNNTDTASMLDQAYNLLDSGQFPQSLSLFTQICNIDSNLAEAWLMRGAIQGEMGNVEEAISLIQNAITVDSNYADPYVTLAQIYTAQQRYKESVELCEKAVAIDPEYIEAWIKLAGLYGILGQLDNSERCSREAIKRSPENAEANVTLANALFGLRKIEEAADAFTVALKYAPNMAELHTSLGNCYIWLNQYELALQSFLRVLELKPQDYNISFLIAIAYQRKGEFDKAIESLEQTLELQPDFIQAMVTKADILEQKGDVKQAKALIDQLIDSGENSTSVAVCYARIAKHFGQQREAIELLKASSSNKSMTSDEQISVNMALASAYDQTKKYDDAFACYQKANSLQRYNYNHEKQVQYIDKIIQTYSTKKINELKSSNIESRMPIFIVGMPRSGTSLVEQILASHPEVYGGGELLDIPDIISEIDRKVSVDEIYPVCVSHLTQQNVDEITENYLVHRQQNNPSVSRYTDKLPHNFQHIGLIKQLFPEAHIIHCLRDPLDNCLSCYFTDFQGQHPYTYDLEQTGLHYNEHLRVMSHWKDTLKMPVLTVRYEDIVADQEAMTRKIIDFVGLEWDGKCLRFYESDRHTLTASYDQVRKPIYTKSVQRWRNFERYLQPLRDALGDTVDQTS